MNLVYKTLPILNTYLRLVGVCMVTIMGVSNISAALKQWPLSNCTLLCEKMKHLVDAASLIVRIRYMEYNYAVSIYMH